MDTKPYDVSNPLRADLKSAVECVCILLNAKSDLEIYIQNSSAVFKATKMHNGHYRRRFHVQASRIPILTFRFYTVQGVIQCSVSDTCVGCRARL